jgi:DtxR family Mn-dependent transcriptional regulator
MKENKELFQGSHLTSHMEDYLEAIIMLSEKLRVVRVKDIAKSLDIKMPSVTAALNKLKEMGYIDYEKYGFIELTGQGKEIAERIYFRHRSLSDFFSQVLLLGHEEAEIEACKVEHALSPEVFRKLYRLFRYIQTEETEGNEWVKGLKKYIDKA